MTAPAPHLSRQQLHCLRLAAAGHTARQIGTRLWVSPSAVSSSLHRVRVALRARNITHAVALAMQLGLVTAEHLELP